jgi:hypothetical protein
MVDDVSRGLEIRPVSLDIHSKKTVLDVIRAECVSAYDNGRLTPDARRVFDSLTNAFSDSLSSRLYTKPQLHRIFTDISHRALDQGRLTLEATLILGDVLQELRIRPVELDVHSNQVIFDKIRAVCFPAYRDGYYSTNLAEVVNMLFRALGIEQRSRLHSKPSLSCVFADVSRQALEQGILTADTNQILDEVAWQLDIRRPDLPVLSDKEVRRVVGAACDQAHESGALKREVIRSSVVLIRVLGAQSRSDLHTKDMIYRKIQFTLWYAGKLGYFTSEVQQTMDLIADTLGIERVRLLPGSRPAATEP